MTRISRRSLLTSGAAAGVLAASGMGLAAQTPKSGGVLTAAFGDGLATDTWDARRHSSLFMMAAAHGAVFDCLTEIGPDGALHGELAESWSARADAQLWTFELRKDVIFHNGKPFVAEDVLESFALHRARGVSPAEPLLRDVVDLRAIGSHRVQFELAAPNADFPYLLSDYHLVIYPAGYTELAMQNGIGTGLYRVDEFRPGHSLSATRFADHYKEQQAGFFNDLYFFNLPDPAARLHALLEGHVDVAAQLSPVHAKQMTEKRGMALQSLQGNQHFGFALDRSALGENAALVQRAVKHAVDRDAFVANALQGYGRAAADTPIGPSNPYFETDLRSLDYDPDQAKILLRRAGVDALTAHVHERVDPAAVSEFHKQMARVGLEISFASENAQIQARCASGRATEDWALSTYCARDAAWNLSRWKDSRFDTQLRAARSEMDAAKRKAHYADLQALVQRDGGLVVPAFAAHLQATSASIAMPQKVGAQYALDNARFAERWWHA